MKMNPLTQADLRGVQCQTPGCDHQGHGPLFLHGRCHPEAGTWASYEDGVITIVCATCEKLVVKVAVAEGGS